jgi:hypothetical protein
MLKCLRALILVKFPLVKCLGPKLRRVFCQVYLCSPKLDILSTRLLCLDRYAVLSFNYLVKRQVGIKRNIYPALTILLENFVCL